MRTPVARATIAVAVLAAAIALFVVLSGSDDAGPESAAMQPQSAQGTSGDGYRDTRTRRSEGRSEKSQARKSARQSSERQAARIKRIVVRGGKPVGGVKRLEYESGERVRFAVRSDVADEVHVHGFDITKDVRAGDTVRFEFPADIEGVFEVELHAGHVKIAEVRVRP